MPTKLTVSTVIDAPLETVWDAFWNPAHIVNWCFASDDWCAPWAKGESPKVGEVFVIRMEARDGSFGFDMSGQYTLVEPMKKLNYTMGEMKEYFLDAGRVVDVTFEVLDPPSEGGIQGGSGTEPLRSSTTSPSQGSIRITETFDAEDIHPAEMQVAGWSAILGNLKKYVESL